MGLSCAKNKTKVRSLAMYTLRDWWVQSPGRYKVPQNTVMAEKCPNAIGHVLKMSEYWTNDQNGRMTKKWTNDEKWTND